MPLGHFALVARKCDAALCGLRLQLGDLALRTLPAAFALQMTLDALIDFFLLRFARELGRPGLRITDEARARLRAYDWPGNVRELQMVVRRAAILAQGDAIEVQDVPLVASRPVFDVALEMSGLGEAELRRLLDPAALTRGGLHGAGGQG